MRETCFVLRVEAKQTAVLLSLRRLLIITFKFVHSNIAILHLLVGKGFSEGTVTFETDNSNKLFSQTILQIVQISRFIDDNWLL